MNEEAKAMPFLTDVKTLRARARENIGAGNVTFTYEGDAKKTIEILQSVLATERHYEQEIRPLPKEERERKLSEMANSVQAGTPPRENAREQRTIDEVNGRGTISFASCVMVGTCCYRQTGLLQAFAAHTLIHAAPRKVGFASPTAAFGHREIFSALESHGLVKARVSS